MPNAHRNVRVAAGTRIGTAETFAIDYVKIDGGRFYQWNRATFAQYSFFGTPLLAVDAGFVVGLHDGMVDTIALQHRTCMSRTISVATVFFSGRRRAFMRDTRFCGIVRSP